MDIEAALSHARRMKILDRRLKRVAKLDRLFGLENYSNIIHWKGAGLK